MFALFSKSGAPVFHPLCEIGGQAYALCLASVELESEMVCLILSMVRIMWLVLGALVPLPVDRGHQASARDLRGLGEDATITNKDEGGERQYAFSV